MSIVKYCNQIYNCSITFIITCLVFIGLFKLNDESVYPFKYNSVEWTTMPDCPMPPILERQHGFCLTKFDNSV